MGIASLTHRMPHGDRVEASVEPGHGWGNLTTVPVELALHLLRAMGATKRSEGWRAALPGWTPPKGGCLRTAFAPVAGSGLHVSLG